MESLPVLIRVDGGDVIGYGHFMRSRALAEGFLEKGIPVHFYSRIIDGSAERLLSYHKYRLSLIPEDIPREDEANWVIENYSGTWATKPDMVVVDGYHFDQVDWEVYSDGPILLVTDAFGGKDYRSADIVYNAYTDAEELDYSTAKPSALLAGPDYALLRNDVISAKSSRPEIEKVKRILVNGGGVDEHNVAGKIAKGLKHVSPEFWPEKAFFITGREYPFHEDLKLHLFDLPFAEHLIEPNDWVQILSSVDMAVIAGGSTQYEAAYLGTPYLSFIVEENQLGLTKTMSDLGITPYVGWLKEKNPAEIGRIYESMVKDIVGLNRRLKKGQNLIDGRGVHRVIQQLIALLNR